MFDSVGLIRTESMFTLGPRVAIVPMGSEHVPGGVQANITGWGTLSFGGPIPNNLRWITATVLDNENCRSRLSANNARLVFDHKLCTFVNQVTGICERDSGGPLVANGVLIGTASWLIPCARGFPDGFDRTAWFRPWILETMALHP
jgi:trypsin